jgi:hypothetical protein
MDRIWFSRDPVQAQAEQMQLPAEYASLVRSAVSQRKVPQPAAASLGLPGETLLGTNSATPSFSLISPVGIVIETDRPTFRWKPFSYTTRYTVQVFDSLFQPMAVGQVTALSEWTATAPLRRGKVYSWQVTANSGTMRVVAPAPRDGEAKFLVLDANSVAKLDTARREYAGNHLLLGLLYARTGLRDRARAEMEELRREYPRSALAGSLADSLQKQAPTSLKPAQ